MENSRNTYDHYNTPFYRAFDVQALVGNISGYIGLCLGYSLLQIPELVIMIFCKAKRYCLMKIFKRSDITCTSINKNLHYEEEMKEND